MNEWKPIKDYEDSYKISNDGQIRSIDKYVNTSNQYNAKSKRLIKGKLLHPIFNGQYYVVGLSKKSNCIIGNSKSSYGYIWRLEYEN